MAGGNDHQEERGGSRGGEAEQEERTDGWMTTYSDMVTLLLTFFVLMFAISNVDQQKAMLFFAGLSRDGLSAVQFEEILEYFNPGDDPGVIFFPTPSPGDDDSPAISQALQDLFDAMQAHIEENDLGDSIALTFNGEFLLLTLANDIWFDSGRADIKPLARESAVELAGMLKAINNPDEPFEVVVAGHTDNVPINTVQFPSNWHVSVTRAVNFLEILITESGLDSTFFYARGCGEERPIASNDSPEGRQANRRVEVMISVFRDDVSSALIFDYDSPTTDSEAIATPSPEPGAVPTPDSDPPPGLQHLPLAS